MRKISEQDMVIFYHQLSTLVSAGIPLSEACDILLYGTKQAFLHSFILLLKSEIEAGRTFASGFKRHPKYFDAMTCHLIHIGEQTGTLDTMLSRISHYQEKTLALKNKIKQALLYPAIILCVALIITLTLLIFVVPQFADIFSTFHHELPFFTAVIVRFSFLIRHDYAILLLPIIAIGLLRFYYHPSKKLQLAIDKIQFQLPFYGNFIQKLMMARFSRSLASVLSAGVPMMDALKLMKNITHNRFYQIHIHQIQIEMTSGLQLHFAMQTSPLFSSLMIQMVKVGEETGSLEYILEKTAEFYDSEIDCLLKSLSHCLEPLIIMILGVLIGGLVIAMYLPIFKLGTVI